MKKNLIVLFSCIFFSCTDHGQNQVKSTDELIAKAIEALGGHDSIKAIHSQIWDGHYIEPGYNLIVKAHTEQMRPDYRLIGDGATPTFAEGYNNGKTWEYSKERGITWSTGEAEAATRRGAEFDLPFIDWKEKRHEPEFKGMKQIENRNYYELKIKMKDGWIVSYFFDTHSFLPVYLRKAMPLHAVGNDIDYLVTLTDYRRINGVLLPFSKIERDIRSGKMINATMMDTVIINRKIDTSRFDPLNLIK